VDAVVGLKKGKRGEKWGLLPKGGRKKGGVTKETGYKWVKGLRRGGTKRNYSSASHSKKRRDVGKLTKCLRGEPKANAKRNRDGERGNTNSKCRYKKTNVTDIRM